MPPSRIGTYSNFTPVRFSIAGIASWLRKALGLPKSNRNCGAVGLNGSLPDVTDSYMISVISISLAVRFWRDQPDVPDCGVRCNARAASLEVWSRRSAGHSAISCLETGGVAGEQRADGVLVMRLVAGDVTDMKR